MTELTIFTPAPGILLVDPIEKVKKSDMLAVADALDVPHQGIVVAVGDPKPYDESPGHALESQAKVGDKILYSIVGCEKTRLEYEGDYRHEFVIVPFVRCLGILKI